MLQISGDCSWFLRYTTTPTEISVLLLVLRLQHQHQCTRLIRRRWWICTYVNINRHTQIIQMRCFFFFIFLRIGTIFPSTSMHFAFIRVKTTTMWIQNISRKCWWSLMCVHYCCRHQSILFVCVRARWAIKCVPAIDPEKKISSDYRRVLLLFHAKYVYFMHASCIYNVLTQWIDKRKPTNKTLMGNIFVLFDGGIMMYNRQSKTLNIWLFQRQSIYNLHTILWSVCAGHTHCIPETINDPCWMTN